jgi:hypothetical protein
MVTTPERDEPETIASFEGLREAGADEIVVHGRSRGNAKLAHAWREKRRVCARNGGRRTSSLRPVPRL